MVSTKNFFENASLTSKGEKAYYELNMDPETDSDIDSDTDSSTTDSDEPMYCLCQKKSAGRMIKCDNDLCYIEWFHFTCLKLKVKPKGNWYCPKCQGATPNVMKPKSVFLKELEQYNKQKEAEYEPH